MNLHVVCSKFCRERKQENCEVVGSSVRKYLMHCSYSSGEENSSTFKRERERERERKGERECVCVCVCIREVK